MKNKTQFFKKENKSRHTSSLRLTFSYQGNEVQLISQQAVKMVSPSSDSLTVQEGQTGFWYELWDAQGDTLYRRVIQNPIKFVVEVRTEDPETPLNWEEVAEPKGTFVLLAPDLRQVRTLALFSSPLEPKKMNEPAKELTRFDLTKVSKGKEE